MTSRKQEISERLQREFEICDKHILRINEALKELSDILPLTAESYASLDSEQIRCLDQFIFRFSKLLDKLCPVQIIHLRICQHKFSQELQMTASD